MRNRILAALAAIAVAFVLSVPSAHADSFDFTTQGWTANSNLGNGVTINGTGGATITVSSYFFPSGDSASGVYYKVGTVGETGLGVTGGTSGGEISDTDYLSFDMSNSGGTSGTFEIGSVQSGESFYVCVSSSADSLGTCGPENVGNGSNNGIMFVNVNWSSDTPFVNIIAGQNDVLVASGIEVPEAGTLALLGIGILSLAGSIRRKIMA